MFSKWLKSIAIMLVLLFTCLFMIGCGAEKNWPIGSGDLPQHIGDIHRDQSDVNVSLIRPDQSLQELGFASQTGKWFMYNGNGNLGYGISSGTMKAGEEITVSVSTPAGTVKVQRDVRIQLFERGIDNEALEQRVDELVHLDQVSSEEGQLLYAMPLPDKENTSYILSANILDAEGQVEDTLVTVIYVPKQEMNAGLALEQDVYSSSAQEAQLILTNAGPTVLGLGTYYTVEKLVGNTWRVAPFPTNFAFNDIGIVLSPGNDYEQTVYLGDWGKGKFRIIKNVWAEGLDLSVNLAAEFTIE